MDIIFSARKTERYLNWHDPYEIQEKRQVIKAKNIIAEEIYDLSGTGLAQGRSTES